MEGDKNYRDLRKRLLDYSVRIIRLAAKIPNTPEGRIIRVQLAKSGTSPGAHHREACRSRSTAEFVSKMNGGLQELDEAAYWLEILVHSRLLEIQESHDLWQETDELIRIFVSWIKNAKN